MVEVGLALSSSPQNLRAFLSQKGTPGGPSPPHLRPSLMLSAQDHPGTLIIIVYKCCLLGREAGPEASSQPRAAAPVGGGLGWTERQGQGGSSLGTSRLAGASGCL